MPVGLTYSSPFVPDQAQLEWEKMAELANRSYVQPPKQNLEDLMVNDPFYQSGLIDLENVKSFEEDPRFTQKTAPYAVKEEELAKSKRDYYGYTYPGDKIMYVDTLNNPTTETAATTTHEGIHNVFEPYGAGAGVLEGIGSEANSALGPDIGYSHEELMTNWLANQIHGEAEPFNAYTMGVDWGAMDRPGTGPLGKIGIMKILAKRGRPFLKKIGLRAHKNIEARYRPTREIFQPTGGGWTQTNTGGGRATFQGPGGQTHQGWSNTPEGTAAAAASEGPFAQGGRIGSKKRMARGGILGAF